MYVHIHGFWDMAVQGFSEYRKLSCSPMKYTALSCFTSRFFHDPEKSSDNTQTNTCALIRPDFLWYTDLFSINRFTVLKGRSLCHCFLYADTTSLSIISVSVTMRNLPASFFSVPRDFFRSGISVISSFLKYLFHLSAFLRVWNK